MLEFHLVQGATLLYKKGATGNLFTGPFLIWQYLFCNKLEKNL
jgi:hypothetical protein